MKIKYNETDKSIEIKDGMKTHYFVMKLLMSLNLLNAILNLYDVNKTGFGFIEIVWLILGIASIIILFLFVYKKSTSEKIPVDKIERIKEKSIFGRRRFSIQLKDGKNRDLNEIKMQSEFNELKKMFSEIGIAN
ncbi:hypothetical protein QO206_06520 [Leeuwenhoekiella aequorea]|uniref:hypothetical protein n=1 Tax=Leeuwenhoekiella aequorea TaxID=283736 RepID=UPI00352E31B8|tara:strand:+ start:72 stop:473 length:402 start_codon:yes stop_codon:yes gene_type:complete